MPAVAGTVNHGVVVGPCGSWLKAISSALSSAPMTISTSKA